MGSVAIEGADCLEVESPALHPTLAFGGPGSGEVFGAPMCSRLRTGMECGDTDVRHR